MKIKKYDYGIRAGISSFFSGMGRVLDLGDTLSSYEVNETEYEYPSIDTTTDIYGKTDYENLQSDMDTIGRDFQKAVAIVLKEEENNEEFQKAVASVLEKEKKLKTDG